MSSSVQETPVTVAWWLFFPKGSMSQRWSKLSLFAKKKHLFTHCTQQNYFFKSTHVSKNKKDSPQMQPEQYIKQKITQKLQKPNWQQMQATITTKRAVRHANLFDKNANFVPNKLLLNTAATKKNQLLLISFVLWAAHWHNLPCVSALEMKNST